MRSNIYKHNQVQTNKLNIVIKWTMYNVMNSAKDVPVVVLPSKQDLGHPILVALE